MGWVTSRKRSSPRARLRSLRGTRARARTRGPLPLLAFPLGSDVADPTTQKHWVDWTPFTYPINMTRHPAAGGTSLA